MINDQHFSGLAIDRMNALRVAAGGRANSYHDEIMMELAYGAQLGRAMRISPNVQYIVHPDSQARRCALWRCPMPWWWASSSMSMR
jgi:porin